MVRLLLELAEAHGQRSGTRCEISLPLSHQDLANLIGVTRETVTVVLGQLQAERLIEVRRRRLIVTDGYRLTREAQGGTAVPSLQAKPPAV
jgi:CRP/FNR family cyclic AMP-dependent transcriptional regulator